MTARLILALVLSLYAVHAKYTIRLYRTPMAATTLSTTNKDLHVTEGSEPKNLPLADEIYQVEVAIGEPPQRLNLTLDYQSAHTYVFTNKRLRWTVDCYTRGATRNWFKLDTSRTLDNSSDDAVGFGFDNPFYQQPYLPYTNECGANVSYVYNERMPIYHVKDTFSLAGLTLESTPFVVVDGARGILNPAWKSDGVLGVLRIFDTRNRTDSPLHPNWVALDRILQEFQGPQTTAIIYFDKEAPTDFPSAGGLLTLGAADDARLQTFGGIDDVNCEDAWSYPEAEIRPSIVFTIVIQSVSFGDFHFVNTYKDKHEQPEHFIGVLVSSTSFMRVPLLLLGQIVAAVNASYDTETDTYYVPCASVSSLPPLIFRIPFEHVVPPEDYARPVYNDVKGRCTLMVSSERLGDHHADANHDARSVFRLGTTFTRSYCLLLDYSNGSVALTKRATSKGGNV